MCRIDPNLKIEQCSEMGVFGFADSDTKFNSFKGLLNFFESSKFAPFEEYYLNFGICTDFYDVKIGGILRLKIGHSI